MLRTAGLVTASLLLGTGAADAQPPSQTISACAACHGPGGNAQGAQFPSIASQPKVFIENQLVLIREGLRDIPAMKDVMSGMKDEEIIALAKYFAAQPITRKPAQIQPEKYRLGAQTSSKMLCGTCHLADYAGQNQVPRLAWQNEDYLHQALRQFRDNPGPGRDTIMSASLYGLNDVDLANLAHYLANYNP
ncbi:MAG: c-type cytochrome [Burkholderiales bacterium]